MSIRIGNSCLNCESFQLDHTCSVHHVKVSEKYTCNSFEMKSEVKNDPSCVSCVRLESSSCAHPKKAAPEMLCSQWAPHSASA